MINYFENPTDETKLDLKKVHHDMEIVMVSVPKEENETEFLLKDEENPVYEAGEGFKLAVIDSNQLFQAYDPKTKQLSKIVDFGGGITKIEVNDE